MKCLRENDSDDDPLPPPIRKRPHRQLEEALGMDDNYDGFSCSNMEKSDVNQDVCVKKVALRATKMTNVTRRAFIGKIAAAMLYYK